jgi:DNA polymerase-3 subunit gamma/tau
VEAVLGIAGQATLAVFIDAIRAGDYSGLLGQVQETVNAGKDLSSICRDLAEYVRNLLVVKVAGGGENLLDAETFDLEALRRQAEGFHADELHQIFSLLSRTESEMKRSSLPQQVFEMALLRLAEVRPFQHIDDMIRAIDEMTDATGEPAGVAVSETPAAAAPAPAAVPPARPQVEERAISGDTPAASPEAWEQVKQEISGKKSVFMHYLESCRVIAFGGSELHLGFTEPYTRDLVDKEENRALLVQAVKDVTGREVKLVTSVIKGGKPPEDGHREPEKKNPSTTNPLMSKSESEIIQQALDVFGGVLVR